MTASATPEGLAPGQYYSKRWIYYSAFGEPQIDPATWRLKVSGLVERPTSWSLSELEDLPQVRLKRDFQCVTKWSVQDVVWEGILLTELAQRVGVKTEARWVNLRCADGYSTPVPVEEALSRESLIAFRMNGAPIPIPQGFPARPFFPQLYGWKSAKWLTEIEFAPAYSDGYWEALGYHERGNIWQEERFKGQEGTQKRHRSTGSAPSLSAGLAG